MSESTVDKLSKLISASYFKFVVVGGINTAFNYSLYAFLIFVGLGHILKSRLGIFKKQSILIRISNTYF